MFPDWCYILPVVIGVIIVGLVSIAAWEAFWFIVHHWTWIWPNLKHFVHWYLLGT